MYDFYGVKFEMSKMNTEELLELRTKIRELLTNVEFQLQMRKRMEHKYSSGNH